MSGSELDQGGGDTGSTDWNVDPSSSGLNAHDFIDNSGRVPSVRWGALGGYIINSLIWGVFTAIIIVWTNFTAAIQSFLGGLANTANAAVGVFVPAELFNIAFGETLPALQGNVAGFVIAMAVTFGVVWAISFGWRVMFR